MCLCSMMTVPLFDMHAYTTYQKTHAKAHLCLGLERVRHDFVHVHGGIRKGPELVGGPALQPPQLSLEVAVLIYGYVCVWGCVHERDCV